MLYRGIRKKATGEWVNVLFTVAVGTFTIPESSHRDSVASALSVLPNELETVESDTDMRSGVMIDLPVAAPMAEEVTRQSFVALSKLNPDLLTDSEIKGLLSFISKDVLKA